MNPRTYQALALKHGLIMYWRTGIKPNSAWSPRAMLDTAGAITGKRYKYRQYEKAIADLEHWLAERNNDAT